MGHFCKGLPVRTSIKIQESLVKSYRDAKENAETQANIPKMIDELNKKMLLGMNNLNITEKILMANSDISCVRNALS